MFTRKPRAYVRRRVAARYEALLQAKKLVEAEDAKVKAALRRPLESFCRQAFDAAMADRKAAEALHTEMLNLYFKDEYTVRQSITQDALGWKGDVVYLPA